MSASASASASSSQSQSRSPSSAVAAAVASGDAVETSTASPSADSADSIEKAGADDTSPQPESEPTAEAAAESVPEPLPAALTSAAALGVATAGDWQAIWSPAHNAYYFFNNITQQTTWENPLVPAASSSADPSASLSSAESSSSRLASAPPAIAQLYALQEAAAVQGIDPALAHLDPSLAGPSSSSYGYAAHAKFNSRTGAFTAPDARAPEHLSEYERARRMSSVYFDVSAWEADVAARKQMEEEEGGKKRKRPSKKDLERFKEQKRLKKIAKTAWLRT